MTDEYFKQQTEQFLSFESDNEKWKDGQRRFLTKYFLDYDKSLKILDVACGDGVGLSWFKENEFKDVYGVDFSPKKVERALEYKFPVFEENFHNLSFDDNIFDIVYSSHTLEHSNNPTLALKEWSRVMKPDGTFILVLPYPDTGHDIGHLGKFELKTTQAKDKAEGLCEFLTSNGFEIISKEFDDFRQPEVWLILKKKQ